MILSFQRKLLLSSQTSWEKVSDLARNDEFLAAGRVQISLVELCDGDPFFDKLLALWRLWCRMKSAHDWQTGFKEPDKTPKEAGPAGAEDLGAGPSVGNVAWVVTVTRTWAARERRF
jgi:hypothetical protein